MPRIGFICPDGEKIRFEDCLAGCRMGWRCLTKTTLKVLSKASFPWTGRPGVTQLIVGTRQELLRIKHDYFVDPPSLMFMLLGIGVHRALEAADISDDIAILEGYIQLDGIGGRADCYEVGGGYGFLTDYKIAGSFMVAKALGIISKRIPDPSGALYKRSGYGYKRGDPKMITIFEQDPEAVDCKEWEYQMNYYRLFFEKVNLPVDGMHVQATVRDGGTQVALSRGIDREVYLIDIARLPDDAVREYFQGKKEALLHYLEVNEMPPPCSRDETWGGVRCRKYCDVWEFCPEGVSAHK